MKKLGWLLLLFVIVLVSLNWFRNAYAQDLGSLTEEQKRELFERYRDRLTLPETAPTPGSPTGAVIDSAPSPRRPVPVLDSQPAYAAKRAVDSGAVLPDFSELRPFGLDLFVGSDEIVPPDDLAATPDYQLGPGDRVLIHVWGRVETDYNLTVDRSGVVVLPRVGEIAAAGLTLDEFKAIVTRRLASHNSDFQISVSLAGIRTLRVFVTGEVMRPGAYTVSSLTSCFNLLYLAGGPNERGSLRRVQLVRRGTTIAEIDLYAFLLSGQNDGDIRLQPGDVLLVPVTGPRVAIRGQIRRPAIYELKAGETAGQFIRLAGGTPADAHLSRVTVERIAERGAWEIVDLDLTPGVGRDKDHALLDGDRLTIRSVFRARNNQVTIAGQVKHPGAYQRSDSTRLLDLIAAAELQPYDVHFDRANLFRRHTDWRTEVIPIDLTRLLLGDSSANIHLVERDSLHIYSVSDVTRERFVTVGGEVKRPGIYPLYDSMSVADLIFLAGSYTRAASRLRAELARTDASGEVTLRYVSLIDSAAERLILREDDRVYIRQIPQWRLHRTVSVEGEVNFPGEYVLAGDRETFLDLIARAGGFAPQAFPAGTVFERVSVEDNLRRMGVSSLLTKSTPVQIDTTGQLVSQRYFDFETASVNRIVIDVEQILATNGERGNIVLEPGDRIFVPSVPSGISVLGAVASNGTIQYRESRSVKDYIEQAGNFAPSADKKGTNLIKANGTVFSGRGTLGRTVNVGDVIVVPTKIKSPSNWLKTVGAITGVTASILTSIILIDRL